MLDDIGAVDMGAEDMGADDMGADDIGAEDMGADDMGADDMGAEDIGAEDIDEDDMGAEDIEDDIEDDELVLEPAAVVELDPQATRVRARPPATVSAERRLMIMGSAPSDAVDDYPMPALLPAVGDERLPDGARTELLETELLVGQTIRRSPGVSGDESADILSAYSPCSGASLRRMGPAPVVTGTRPVVPEGVPVVADAPRGAVDMRPATVRVGRCRLR